MDLAGIPRDFGIRCGLRQARTTRHTARLEIVMPPEGAEAGLEPCDKSRILIVDDEEQTRAALKMILAEELPDHEADFAADGLEALESFGDAHQGVVLMDLWMPNMDGHTAFREMEKMCAERDWRMPAVIFCVGYNPSDEIEAIVKANPMHGIQPKPLRWDSFFTELKKRLQ